MGNVEEGFSALVKGHDFNLPLHVTSVHCTTVLVQLSLLAPSGVFGLQVVSLDNSCSETLLHDPEHPALASASTDRSR